VLRDHALRVVRTDGGARRPRPQLPGAQWGAVVDAAARGCSYAPRPPGGRSGRRAPRGLLDRWRTGRPGAIRTGLPSRGLDDGPDAELDGLTTGGSASRSPGPPVDR